MIRLLGSKIRRLREQAGLSQTDLAKLLGLSQQSKGVISEIESGKKLPRAEIILRIAQHFNVTTDYLLIDDITESKPFTYTDKNTNNTDTD